MLTPTLKALWEAKQGGFLAVPGDQVGTVPTHVPSERANNLLNINVFPVFPPICTKNEGGDRWGYFGGVFQGDILGDPDAFEERAAILEFEAGFSREEAERRAAAMVGARRG